MMAPRARANAAGRRDWGMRHPVAFSAMLVGGAALAGIILAMLAS